MARIHCDRVTEGLRASEAVASFVDFFGRRHFIRVERDFLTREHDQYFLPVGVVRYDLKTDAALIELPHEAETGANRLWIKKQEFLEDEPIEALA